MKKLFIIFITVLACTSSLNCMEQENTLCITPEKTDFYLNAEQAKQELFKINQENARLADPIAARNIITNFKKRLDPQECTFNLWGAKQFTFPGAIKCRELSNQLYNDNLTADKAKSLFQQGAIIDFSVNEGDGHYPSTGLQMYPLEYWCYKSANHDNKDRSLKIMKEMLTLGANLNDSRHQPLLECIINVDNPDLFAFVLTNYKTKINKGTWSFAGLDRKEKYLDLLVEHATQEELTEGLISCMGSYDTIYFEQKEMQKFIDKGTNPSIAVATLMKKLSKVSCPINAEHPFVKNLLFLAQNGAYSQETLNRLQSTRDLFDHMIDALLQNQPSDPFMS